MLNRKNAALAFILITVTLDMLAFGIIAPVFPKLVLNFLGNDASRAAAIFGVFGTVFALMQFVFAPILGVLSDRYGRRPVILLSNFGLGIDYVIMALAPNLHWLFAGRVISGITAASIVTAMAYIADVTPAPKRAAAFGMVGAAFGVGFIVGPGVGGLLGAVNPRLPFWVAAGMSIANALYGLIVLPESLARERRSSTFAWRRANPIGSLALLKKHTELLRLATVTFVEYVAHEVLPSVFVLYAIYRYAWGERAIGGALALVGVCSVIVSGILVGPIVKRIGERSTLLAGLVFGAAGYVVFGLAPTSLVMLAGIPIMMLWSLCGPAAQGLMTHRVSASEQGELQGALSSIRGIAMLIGPGIFTGVFALFIAPHHPRVPGAPWFLGAVMLIAAATLAFAIPRVRADELAATGIAEPEPDLAML